MALISALRFSPYWLLSCDTGGYAISRQNTLELHLGCHTCWLSFLYWYAGGEDGRSLARCTVTWLPNFLGWVDLLIHGAPLAHAWAPLYIGNYKTNRKLFVTMDWWQCCDPKRRKLLPHLWQEILLPHTTERETKKSRRKISSGPKKVSFTAWH